MRIKFTILGVLATVLSGCSDSSPSNPTVVTTPNPTFVPTSNPIREVTLSGAITYDFVPINTNGIGLDYTSIRQEPVRGVTVVILDTLNVTLASTITDSTGRYSILLPKDTNIKVRVLAKIIQSGINNWDVKVVDNTNNDALYGMEGAFSSTGLGDSTRNLHASSGWGGSSYTRNRVAAPFAILDNAYKSIQKIIIANKDTVFPPLLINWSINNVPVSGDTSLGQITTSHYRSGNLFILGDANSDTDEYDAHIITHEWAHYYEDKLSRTDSIGGPHSLSDILDIRVAFSEGFANAFSGMVLDNPVYSDTLGLKQANGFSFNMENDRSARPGWFSSSSVQHILYDLYDDSNEENDVLSMGFTPLHNIFIGAQKNTVVFTSIFSFIALLRDENIEDVEHIDSIVLSESIATITDIYGTGRTNRASELPNYMDLNIGATVNFCPSYIHGTPNKLGNRQFIKLNITNENIYTIRVSRSRGIETTDPDFLLYVDSLIYSSASGVANNETGTISLNTGKYKLDVSDFNNVVGACFDVTLNLSR